MQGVDGIKTAAAEAAGALLEAVDTPSTLPENSQLEGTRACAPYKALSTLATMGQFLGRGSALQPCARATCSQDGTASCAIEGVSYVEAGGRSLAYRQTTRSRAPSDMATNQYVADAASFPLTGMAPGKIEN